MTGYRASCAGLALTGDGPTEKLCGLARLPAPVLAPLGLGSPLVVQRLSLQLRNKPGWAASGRRHELRLGLQSGVWDVGGGWRDAGLLLADAGPAAQGPGSAYFLPLTFHPLWPDSDGKPTAVCTLSRMDMVVLFLV